MPSHDPARNTPAPAPAPSGTAAGPSAPVPARGSGDALPAAEDKHAWRRRFRSRREAADSATRRAEALALAAVWRTEILATLPAGATVCAYIPSGGEPGGLELLDDARAADLRVLVPVTGEPGPLAWAEYTGPHDLRPGRFGLREPQGPRLDASAVAEAALILVPALAADRRGVRLGRGGGYYDRTLPLASPGAALVCLVRDEELVDRLPEDPHDVRVGAVLTPGGGLLRTDRR